MEQVAARVLVVDDDPSVLRLLQHVLAADFNVRCAGSAEEALVLLDAERFHCVLSDQMLPGMRGVELLRRVATLQPHAARILITASGRVEDAQEAINLARVRRFIAKPFHVDELLGMVGQAVHESALGEIKERLINELKQRNSFLTQTLQTVEQKQRERPVAELAVRDALTGLYSHRYFQEALEADVRRGRLQKRKVAIVLLDVQDFRSYNEEHGYDRGDELLQRVAHVVGAVTAEAAERAKTVEVAARYGPDVFAVMLPDASLERARAVADELQRQVCRLPLRSPVLARVGYAEFPQDGADRRAVITAAEGRLRASGRSVPGIGR